MKHFFPTVEDNIKIPLSVCLSWLTMLCAAQPALMVLRLASFDARLPGPCRGAALDSAAAFATQMVTITKVEDFL